MSTNDPKVVLFDKSARSKKAHMEKEEQILKEAIDEWTKEILKLLAPWYDESPYMLEGVLKGISNALEQKRLEMPEA